MPIQDANTLKGYFNKGDVPTEDNYVDLIDTIFRPSNGDMERSVYDPDLDGVVESSDNSDKLDGQHGSYYSPSIHTHDDRYYTETESDQKYAVLIHDHDNRYYTKMQSDINYATAIHKHDHTLLSNIGTYTHAEIDSFVNSKAAVNGLASLNSSGLVNQNPANSTAVPTPNKIPISDGAAKLDGWINDASTSIKGKVQLATDGEVVSGKVVQGNDNRLSNSRTPTTHNTTHISTGSDPIAAAVAGGASGLMTGADKTKLDGIATGAEVNVNADWNALTGDAQILNKPTTYAPTAHNLLSDSHGDTLADTVVAGDIIIGNATPKFARLAKGMRGYRMTVGETLPEWQEETGWIDAGAMTWTYASASAFTVAGDKRAIFQKGTLLKFKQPSLKYAVVASSSYSYPNTTVNIVVNTTYTIINATITEPYYSYQANPQGWPASFAFTPIITAGTGTFTNVSASGSLNIVGRMAFVTLTITITTNGTAATNVIASLPITSAALAIFSGRENAVTGVMLQGRLSASDTSLNIFKYDNTYPGGTGYVIYVSGSYLI